MPMMKLTDPYWIPLIFMTAAFVGYVIRSGHEDGAELSWHAFFYINQILIVLCVRRQGFLPEGSVAAVGASFVGTLHVTALMVTFAWKAALTSAILTWVVFAAVVGVFSWLRAYG